MHYLILLTLIFNIAHAMQCEFDAIETIEYVADFGKVPEPAEVADIGRAFSRPASDFPDYLIDGVKREHSTYKNIYQKVVDGDLSMDQFETFQRNLTDQVGRDGYLRVMSPQEIATIQRQGGINPATRGEVFFNNPASGTGAHMGHGGNVVVVKCPTERCAQYFHRNTTSTGSGFTVDEAIPIDDLEFIIPDVKAAAEAAGISL